MRYWHRHITLAFGLLFLLSGMANAYARAYMAGAHSIEICAELGNSHVTLGVNGEALPEGLHLCDICCVAVGVLSEPPAHIARIMPAGMAALSPASPALAPVFETFSKLPRGPPVLG